VRTQGFDLETLWEQLMLRSPAVHRFLEKVTLRLLDKGEDLQVGA
jgi:hypothetical protein